VRLHGRGLVRVWLLVVAVVLIVGHGLLIYGLSRMTPVVVLSIVAFLIVMWHLGLPGLLRAQFRRRGRSADSGE
jgi:hypothetical protein